MKKSIAFFFIFFFVVLSFGAEKGNGGKDYRLKFSVIDLASVNIPAHLGEDFSATVRGRLQREKSFNVSDDAFRPPEPAIIAACEKGDCPESFRGNYQGGVVLVGSITWVKFKAGEKAISRYAVEDLMGEKYILSVLLLDTRTGKIDLRFNKELAAASSIDVEAQRIAREIRAFYFREPAKTPLRLSEDKQEQVKRSEPLLLFSAIGIAPSIIFPYGTFAKIGGSGYGAEGEVVFTIFSNRNIFFAPGLGLYTLTPARENIRSDTILHPRIAAGYLFQVSEEFTLAPFVQAAYLFQCIDGDRDAPPGSSSFRYRSEVYYNPSAGAGVELGYRISDRFYLIMVPSYHIYVEKGSFSHFSKLNLGIRMKWDI